MEPLEVGVYKLLISTDPDFQRNISKSDNFIIIGGGNDTEPDTGTIVIIKTLETVDGDPHENVTFYLYKVGPIPRSITTEDSYITGITNGEGELVFEGLEIGDYIIKEVVPEGYTSNIDEDGKEVKVSAGDIIEVHIINSTIEEAEELGSLT